MADKKEFTLLVNGVEKSTENVEKLGSSLEKVDVKAKGMSVTAKDVADTYKNELKEIMEYIALQMAKIEAIITELSTHAGQAIEKNIEAGEKLAKNMEKSAEGGLSSIKIKAIEASTLIEAWIDKVTVKSEGQTEKLTQQVERNKELLAKSTEITKEYNEKEKEAGILNLKAHKENVEAHVGELKKYKLELEAASVQTKLYYSSVISQYSVDREEFKKVQEDKAKALKELQNKITETDKTLKESSSSYLDVWKNQHAEIKTKLDNFFEDGSGGFDKFIEKNTFGLKGFLNEFDESAKYLKENITALETKEKAANDEKYKKKIEKLDKELAEVRTEATKYEKEKEKAEKEQAEAKTKADKYKADIAKIKEAFEIKDTETNVESPDAATDTEKLSSSIESLTTDIPESESSEDKNKVNPPSEEEMQAAQDRITELEALAKAEEDIVNAKKDEIEKANNAITESNRSVLLEQMRIEDDKKKLEEEKAKKDAEIAEKAQKRKDKLEKLEKIKAKAQLVLDIATATKEIAKGVATAWGKGPILGPPLAALVALNGAMQLKIMTTQLAKFADGGLLHGKHHSQGGMRIEGTNMEVEGGEYIINRESTGKNLGLVKYINEQRRELTPNDLNTFFSRSSQGLQPSFKHMFADGGQLPIVEPVTNIDNDSLIKAIQSIKIEPKVAVTDIHKVQDSMVSVSGWSGV
jgi:hypothetical protein